MKFLCVPCDHPMTLRTVAPPDRGSLSVVYSCPECGYEIAMLTNPYETQLVQSLGVRVGPEPVATRSGVAQDLSPAVPEPNPKESASKCPFAGMIASKSAPAPEPTDASLRWTVEAEARLANIPSFVRPMARTGIEKFARERGCTEVDEKILEAARDYFGM